MEYESPEQGCYTTDGMHSVHRDVGHMYTNHVDNQENHVPSRTSPAHTSSHVSHTNPNITWSKDVLPVRAVQPLALVCGNSQITNTILHLLYTRPLAPWPHTLVLLSVLTLASSRHQGTKVDEAHI